jgi:hypothetical protein
MAIAAAADHHRGRPTSKPPANLVIVAAASPNCLV